MGSLKSKSILFAINIISDNNNCQSCWWGRNCIISEASNPNEHGGFVDFGTNKQKQQLRQRGSAEGTPPLEGSAGPKFIPCHKTWVPDDELLEETAVERLEGLKEMFPSPVRSFMSSWLDWSLWAAKNSVSLVRRGAWVATTSAFIMIMPYFVCKELQDMESSQMKQQQQLLLGGRPS